MRKPLVALLLTIAAVTATPGQHTRSLAISEPQGIVGLGLVLRQLAHTGTFMYAAAHPDDEHNPLLVALSRGQGARVVVASATRGDGGQNEIGPELFDALAVLRTEELEAVHRVDGAEQYFTRAIDFGFSFSTEETFRRWGRQEILGDFVRLIRLTRPDVIVTMSPEGTGGGQHHQASAILAREAYRLAADAGAFPEQMAEGLRPWQARKLYQPAGRGGFMSGRSPAPMEPNETRAVMDVGAYDALLGTTYAELGAFARSMHRCQGMSQILPPPRPLAADYRLFESVMPMTPGAEASVFAGIDTSIEGLVRFVPGEAPGGLVEALSVIGGHAREAQRRLDGGGPTSTLPSLAAGLGAVRDLRSRLGALGLDPDARAEIDERLARKADQFQEALVLGQGLELDVRAADGLVVAGQPVKIDLALVNGGVADVPVTRVQVSGFEDGVVGCGAGDMARVGAQGFASCTATATLGAAPTVTGTYWSRLPDADRYAFAPGAAFGLPFQPTPFMATLDVEIGGVPVSVTRPVQFRYSGGVTGERRMDVHVVPALSVDITPDIAIVPITRTAGRGAPPSREIRVTVTNHTTTAASADVAVEVPAGWRVEPETQPVAFAREDEAVTVRFVVTAPADVRPGAPLMRAVVTGAPGSGALAGARFDRGYQVVEYPHTRRRHLYQRAEATAKVLDVAIAPDLNIGYVMGVGDQVPQALVQLGAKVESIDEDTMAWADLSRFDAIVTGVRAYERRADLRAHNRRLLQYAENGGTVIVQYNKVEDFDPTYAPSPAEIGRERVTDEAAPVRVLEPGHPVFTTPNAIGPEAWENWVQERGLYFLGKRDPNAYLDLVETEDPFEYNAGPKRGALVEARVGRGRWVYVGLGLWRQLPAGTDGAFRLMANLVSLGRAAP